MGFDWEKLTKPNELEEGLFIDFKVSYPVQTPKEKLEFIRDAISFANISRAMGKPSYILIGIKDDSREMVGIPHGPQNNPKYWENYKHSLENISKDHIEPFLQIDVYHECKAGKHFACISFTPSATYKAFQVKKAFKNKDDPKDEVHIGESWIRSGESKRKIEPNDIIRRLDFQSVSLLLPKHWLEYCENHIKTVAQTEVINPQTLYFQNGDEAIQSLNEFTNGDKRLFIVEGVAGSGKTTLSKQLSQSLIEQLKYRIELFDRKEVLPGVGLTPLYISLRVTNAKDDSVKNAISRHLVSFKLFHKKPSNIEEIFDLEQVKWLIILDGLDECMPLKRQDICNQVVNFLTIHPSVKIILVTRPVIPDWNAPFPNIALRYQKLSPLTDTQIKNLLAYESNELDVVENALQWIKSNSDIKEIIHYPMYAVVAAAYIVPKPNSQPELDASINSLKNLDFSPNRGDLGKTDGPTSSILSENVEVEAFRLESVNTHSFDLSEPLSDQVPLKDYTSDIEQNADKISISKAKLLDRVLTSLWEREVKKDANIIHKERKWRGALYRQAWHSGGEQDPMLYANAHKCLTEKGLIRFLELGILRELSDPLLIVFFNHLVRCYYAALHVQLLLASKAKTKQIRELINSNPMLQPQVYELAKDIISEDISMYFK